MKESDLFMPVKKFLLEEMGCTDVFAELLDIDVVAICGPCDIAVEMKTSLNFKVIEQAYDNLHNSQYSWIAVPKPKNISHMAQRIIRQHGLGLMTYSERTGNVRIEIPARYNRLAQKRKYGGKRLRDYARDFHRNNIGGVKGGEGETEYSNTMKNIREFLRMRRLQGKWFTVDEILEYCETHYANPKPSVIATLQAHWNRDWCESTIINRKRHFRWKEQ